MAKIVRLPKTKVKPKFKYALQEQLDKLPRDTTMSDVRDHLKKFGISKDEFYWDRAIEFGSDKSIPSDRLLIYCKVFDCAIADLLNHEIKATSIRQKYVGNSKLKSSLR